MCKRNYETKERIDEKIIIILFLWSVTRIENNHVRVLNNVKRVFKNILKHAPLVPSDAHIIRVLSDVFRHAFDNYSTVFSSFYASVRKHCVPAGSNNRARSGISRKFLVIFVTVFRIVSRPAWTIQIPYRVVLYVYLRNTRTIQIRSSLRSLRIPVKCSLVYVVIYE